MAYTTLLKTYDIKSYHEGTDKPKKMVIKLSDGAEPDILIFDRQGRIEQNEYVHLPRQGYEKPYRIIYMYVGDNRLIQSRYWKDDKGEWIESSGFYNNCQLAWREILLNHDHQNYILEPAHQSYYQNGQRQNIQYMYKNRLHDPEPDTPAFQSFYENGNPQKTIHYHNGKKHNDNNFSEVEYYQDGIKKVEKWYQNNLLTRIGGPAIIEYHPNGLRRREEWRNEYSQTHRLSEPSIITYDEEGRIFYKWKAS